MGVWKCQKCGVEEPLFDVAHVCYVHISNTDNPIDFPPTPKKPELGELGIMIHGYRLQQTCSACPEQYDVFDDIGQQVAYFRLRHGSFRATVPDVSGTEVYYATPIGDGSFVQKERVKYLTNAILAVQEFYINRRWNDKDDE